MPCSNPALEAQLNHRLEQIDGRLFTIATIEAKAVPFGTYGVNGEFEPERDRLTTEADRLLDRLVAINGSPKFRFKA